MKHDVADIANHMEKPLFSRVRVRGEDEVVAAGESA